jgi:hypothetical protein
MRTLVSPNATLGQWINGPQYAVVYLPAGYRVEAPLQLGGTSTRGQAWHTRSSCNNQPGNSVSQSLAPSMDRPTEYSFLQQAVHIPQEATRLLFRYCPVQGQHWLPTPSPHTSGDRTQSGDPWDVFYLNFTATESSATLRFSTIDLPQEERCTTIRDVIIDPPLTSASPGK